MAGKSAATESDGLERFHRRANQPATTGCAHQSRGPGWRTSACRCLVGRALARSLSPGDALLAPISAAGMRSQTKVGPFGHPREVYLMSTASSANASFAIVLLLLLAALGALLVVWDANRTNAPWLESRSTNESRVATKPLDRDKETGSSVMPPGCACGWAIGGHSYSAYP